jgi:hypothetical protein
MHLVQEYCLLDIVDGIRRLYLKGNSLAPTMRVRMAARSDRAVLYTYVRVFTKICMAAWKGQQCAMCAEGRRRT